MAVMEPAGGPLSTMISRAKSGFSTAWHNLSFHDSISVNKIHLLLRELERQVYPGFLTGNRMVMTKVDTFIAGLQMSAYSDTNPVYLSRQETFDFLLQLLSEHNEMSLSGASDGGEQNIKIHNIGTKPKSVLDELDCIINQSSTFDKEMSQSVGDTEIDTNEQFCDKESSRLSQKAGFHGFSRGESDCIALAPVDPDEILTESDDDTTSLMDLSHRRSLSYPSTIHEHGCDDDKYSVKEAIDDVQQLHDQLKSKFNLIDVYLSQVKLQNSKDRDSLSDLTYKNEQMIQRLDNIKLQAVSLALKLKVLHLENQNRAKSTTRPTEQKYTFSLPQPDESHKITSTAKPLENYTPSTSKESNSMSLTNEPVSLHGDQALIQNTKTDNSFKEPNPLSLIFIALIVLILAYISYS